jgi:ABC-type uncharacterized transport system permease subunit
MRVLGLIGSVGICVTAASLLYNCLGYELLATKKYLREPELHGCEMNVMGAELRLRFGQLWQDESLAFAVATVTIIITLIIELIAMRLNSNDGRDATWIAMGRIRLLLR